MEVKGKKVLVFGLGISGIGAGQILERHGAEVIMYDGNQKLTEEKIKKQLGEDSSAKIVIGDFPEEVLENLDMTVLFNKQTISVEGANGYSPIDYNVWIYTPDIPYAQKALLGITLG